MFQLKAKTVNLNKKIKPNYMLLSRVICKRAEYAKFESKRMEKGVPVNSNPKKTGISILISDKKRH